MVRIEGHAPLELATKLGDRGFFTWDGNYYALNLTEQLDVEKTGGFLRIGLVHYNTVEEVDRLLEALRELGDRARLTVPHVKYGSAREGSRAEHKSQL